VRVRRRGNRERPPPPGAVGPVVDLAARVCAAGRENAPRSEVPTLRALVLFTMHHNALTPAATDWRGFALQLPDWQEGAGALCCRGQCSCPIAFRPASKRRK
jgi:hypothetical protein